MNTVIEKDITDLRTREKVGKAVLYNHDKENDIIYIDGYVSSNKYTKQLAGELILLLSESFNKLSCNKVLFKIPENEYKKMEIWRCLRFVDDCFVRSHAKINGIYKNLYYMSILKHEYNRFFLNDKNVEIMITEATKKCEDIWECDVKK